MLLNKRLDLDIAHSRLRKAHEADSEARVSSEIEKHLNVPYRATSDQYFLHLKHL